MSRGLVVVVAVIFGCGANAVAGMNEFESCRCSQGIATRGDSKAEVEQKCGKPASRSYTGRSDCREMWLYNFGRNEFMQGVCFGNNGQVKKVLSLDHGY
jgi:hypothetical protein